MIERRKNLQPILLSIALLSLASGCTSFKDASDKNFIGALNAYYSHHDECLFSNSVQFPYEASNSDKSIYGAKAFDALAGSGLMEKQDGKLIGVNRYTLTPAGQRAAGNFCYGHREVTSIASFTPPVMENGMKTTTVTYHYQVKDVPVWAKTEKMTAAFPALAKATSSDPQDTAKLQLTVNGWEKAD